MYLDLFNKYDPPVPRKNRRHNSLLFVVMPKDQNMDSPRCFIISVSVSYSWVMNNIPISLALLKNKKFWEHCMNIGKSVEKLEGYSEIVDFGSGVI